MPKTGARRGSLERTQRAKKVRPGAPLLETRARTILATLVEEVLEGPTGLRLPEPAETVSTAEAEIAEATLQPAQSIDEFSTLELVSIARHGASLEVDGSRYTSDELASLAESVIGEAHLKINNSGSFTAKELAAIARSGPGQVILA